MYKILVVILLLGIVFMSIFKQASMTQEKAIDVFLPQIEDKGSVYIKTTKIKARPAKEGEVIETITSDGKETTNTAKSGDYVVTNLGGSGEEYILSKDKIESRYDHLEGEIYQAKGECMALQYNGEEMSFIASWGESMVLKPGDMICTPLPAKNEVYRIAKKEFESTYKLKD